ncbi:hypothetical protein [Wolbachia endosymbiont of Drosophila tsacasi]|uniref:hypothetical protein n=1 Tax=Wolbachia endosymbiont of Drosophila tsacasi TaxID=3002579 RepID=UPI0023A958BA|nr:hypothetical protein [Wolbachia endosymbiont of Drosophila tsacasi]MDE5062695.1 hypothetical protein [Wolbachia endosymbiont of Drosophila tsacasi]
MVKEWIRGKLGILENEKAIANNAAIDAAQATDIANNTAINVAQSEEIAKLGEAVADQQNNDSLYSSQCCRCSSVNLFCCILYLEGK